MSARRPAGPARPGARSSGSNGGGGFISWLPLLGGLALGAGILVYVINLFFGTPPNTNCPRLNPKKQRWPNEKTVKSWGSLLTRFK